MNLQTDGFAPMLGLWISDTLPEPQAGTEQSVSSEYHLWTQSGQCPDLPTTTSPQEGLEGPPFPCTETQAFSWLGSHSR